MPGRVVVHGPLLAAEMADFDRATDMFVLASVLGPYGTVYSVAMAAGFHRASGRAEVSPFKAVLFDLGDTLIRLAGSGDQLMLRAAAALGVAEVDPAEASAVWQRVLDQASTAEELAKGRDLSTDRHREVWTLLYADAGCERLAPGLSEELYTLTVSAESWEAFPDTLPTLRALRHRNIPVGIVSDTGFDFRPTLDRLGLSPLVDVVVMSFQHGVCKPAPKLFLAACEQLGVEPRDTLMVGDNPLTDGGGIAAGLHVVLVPPPTPTDPRRLAAILSLVAPSL